MRQGLGESPTNIPLKTNPIVLRRGTPQDSAVAGRLMYEASTKYMSAIFGKDEENARKQATRAFSSIFTLPGHRWNYQNAWMAERQEEVVGVLVAYGGNEHPKLSFSLRFTLAWLKEINLAQLPRLVRLGHMLSETSIPIDPNDFYIDTLAVLPQWRRKGVGKELIRFATELAREQQYHRVALDVLASNHGARLFYSKMGFYPLREVESEGLKRYGLTGNIRMAKLV